MRQLYNQHPVYLWEPLAYYLPLITPLPPKFTPGARFGYSNAGYVLLGLVVQAVSGVPYRQFVTQQIIQPLGLCHTGFYRADALPANTALGYRADAATGQVRANIFSLPVVGGPDGGLYTCAEDLNTLWRALFAGRVLPPAVLQAFLAPQVQRGAGKSYGLGVYLWQQAGKTAYYALGVDVGVNFFTAYLPEGQLVASALGNTETSVLPLLNNLFKILA